MDLDPNFFVLVFAWLCIPAIAWIVRYSWSKSNRAQLLRKSTSVIMGIYYALILISIIAAYDYPARTGEEWPLLAYAWLLVFAAPAVAAYVFWEGRVAWP